MTITTPGLAGNYNAFEQGTMGNKYDFNSVFVFGLPATGPRGGVPAIPVPGPNRNIAKYTGGRQASTEPRRGVLFVRDALCNGPFRTGKPYFDLSPHDFRLSPAVAQAGLNGSIPWKPGVAPQGALNPLVNNGFYWNFTVSPQAINMGNLRTFSQAPGYLTLPAQAQSSWTFTSWEEDCEGYGNPRAINHASAYPTTGGTGKTYPGGAYCDIGADELHELIAVGYRFGTTMLIHVDGGSPCNKAIVPMDNKYLWYFGPPFRLAGSPRTVTKPNFRAITHLGTPPTNYTYPPWWSSNWSFTAGGLMYYLPTFADIQPYLIPDIHPWWQILYPGVATLPVWQPTLYVFPNCLGPHPLKNAYLYQNPSAGVINPPGTYPTPAPSSYAWLDANGSPTFYGIGLTPYLGGPIVFSSFTDWCMGTDGVNTVDTFWGTGSCNPVGKLLTALRYSIEVKDSSTWQSGSLANSNQQSFMVIREGEGRQ